MNYLGDFAEDATVYIPFNTFSSDDPSASVTITNLADADIKVHKDGSATEIVTDGATVAIDFDAITGNHLITVDTSADAAYSTGSDYLVRVEGTTVDGATVNAWVGCFSIENRFMRGTDSAATAASLATAQSDLDIITGSDGVTLATAQGNYAPNTSTPPTAAAIRSEMDSNSTQLAAIVADTNELQSDNVPSLIAAVEADTQDIQSRIPAALVSGRMSSDMVAISGSTTAADNQEQAALALVTGAAITGTLSPTQMTTDLTETTNNHYVGRVVIWTSGALLRQQALITAYNGSTKLLTYETATDAPANTDTFVIV